MNSENCRYMIVNMKKKGSVAMDKLKTMNFLRSHWNFLLAIQKILLSVALFLIAAQPLQARIVYFVHTNDLHGHFAGHEISNPDNPDETIRTHSYAHLAAWVEAIRIEAEKEGGKVIFTFGGDLNTGTPESDFLKAEPDIDILNEIGMDVAVLGNHEFDLPLEELYNQIRMSRFPWISANVYSLRNVPLLQPYHIIEVHGKRIAFLGLTTRSTEVIGNPQVVRDVVFRNAILRAKAYMPFLHVTTDMIVALTHMGYYPLMDGLDYAGEIELAEEVPGFDLILGGHSHTLVEGKIINGTPVYQAEAYNQYIVVVKYRFPDEGRPVHLGHRTISLERYPSIYNSSSQDGRRVRELVERVKERILHYLVETDQILSVKIGFSEGDFEHSRDTLYTESRDIGNLIADSQRNGMGSDIAIMNSGGIREGIPAGDITMRRVLTVQPFTNTMGVVEVTGRELYDFFYERLIVERRGGNFPQVSGLFIRVLSGKENETGIDEMGNGRSGSDNSEDLESREDRSEWTLEIFVESVDGHRSPVERNTTYTVAMNNFIGQGGSGYPNFSAAGRFLDSHNVDYELLTDYIKENSPIDPENYREPRIVFE